MGKQFRFIMDEKDKEDFFNYVRVNGRIFETKKNEGTIEIFTLPNYLWINLYLYRDEFGKLEYRESLDNKKYINTTLSPIVEFGETILREKVKEIQRGRLFLEMKYYDNNGNLMKKNELVDKWYKELVERIKNKLECVEIDLNGKVVKEYISKSLVKFVQEGYKLLG